MLTQSKQKAKVSIKAEKYMISIRELADMTGRQSSNLSRTLKTLCAYGFVKLEKLNKTVCPIAKATKFNVIFGVRWEDHAHH